MTMSSRVKFLVTGATSGLGGSILSTLYKNASNPSEIAAASSRPEAASKLQKEYPGTQFRVVDYDDEPSLEIALKGVEKLFFVSSPLHDIKRREKQHSNVIEAAKKVGVGHVYYSSLAFGGYGSDSKASVQQAHITTEKHLKESGISYTSIREGIYTDAFPVFIFWYPNTETIYLTADGPVAYASREELGEASAKLMLRDPSTLSLPNNVALLTGPRTYTFSDIIAAISNGIGKKLNVEQVSRERYVGILAEEDAKEGRGGKPKAFFEVWASLVDAIGQGDAATVGPLMGELLGREPRDAMEHVTEMVREGAKRGAGYTWHQNYGS